jgi:glutathione S-transferase
MGCGGSKATDTKNPTHPPAGGKPIVLHYFNVRARAEPIRLLLAHKAIQYTDHRISFEEWPALKNTFETKQIPCLEIDGKKLFITLSILRYLSQKNGLYPTDRHDVYLSESLADFIGDLFSVFGKLMFVEKNPQDWETFITGEGLTKLKIVENRLLKNQGGKGYFIGSALSFIDFVVFQFVHSHFMLPGQEQRLAKLSTTLPTLKAYAERVLAASPGIQAYLKTRPQTMG